MEISFISLTGWIPKKKNPKKGVEAAAPKNYKFINLHLREGCKMFLTDLWFSTFPFIIQTEFHNAIEGHNARGRVLTCVIHNYNSLVSRFSITLLVDAK